MLMVKNVGKPYEGEPHVRFDEGKVGKPTDPLYSVSVAESKDLINQHERFFALLRMTAAKGSRWCIHNNDTGCRRCRE